MEPEELRKLLKKSAIIASFFVLALLFYLLNWRFALVIYTVVIGVLATLAILLQSGRGGGLAASLGGLGTDSLLGTHSSTPIAKATYVMLGLFVFISMLSARMGAREPVAQGGLLIEDEPRPEAPAPGAWPDPGDEGVPLTVPLDPIEAAPPSADDAPPTAEPLVEPPQDD